MPDVYATITEADRAVQQRLADVIEMRASDPRYQAMVHSYLRDVAFPEEAKVIELGCGTGFVTRLLARWPGVRDATGIDPSPVFIETARRLAADIDNVAFHEADGRDVPFDDASYDVAVINTTLSHVPQPERMLQQAWRLLRPGGWIAVFDGDYSTATVSIGELDPLAVCMSAFRGGFVNDPWIVRRLPQMLRDAGFSNDVLRSHGYAESPAAGYLLSWVDRGADLLAQQGRIGLDLAEALKREARLRSEARRWFGHIAFASAVARKPA